MDKPVIQTLGKQVKMEFKVKIQYKNGSNETVFSIAPPNVNPVTPKFLGMMIKEGNIRNVNMDEIRAWDLEVKEAHGGIVV